MKKDFVLCLYLYLYLTYISLSIILFSSSFSFLFGFFSVFVYVYFWLTLTFYAFKYFVGTVFQFFLFSSCVIYSPIYATIMSCQPLKGLYTPKRTKHPDFFLCLLHEKPVKKMQYKSQLIGQTIYIDGIYILGYLSMRTINCCIR